MVGVIQIVTHIPWMSINVPPNAIVFYKTILPVVNYDMLKNYKPYKEFMIYISRYSSDNNIVGRILIEITQESSISQQT